jgi:hypothetical protein
MPFDALRRFAALTLVVGAASRSAAAQAGPAGTDLYLVPLQSINGHLSPGAPVNLTARSGYDNQPSFSPDGRALWFTRVGDDTHADVCRLDLTTRSQTCLLTMPESEYSPVEAADGSVVVVRVERDSTQRLWRFPPGGGDPVLLLEGLKPVGYYAWVDSTRLLTYVLGEPATLQLADLRGGAPVVLASDIARSLQRIPGGGVSFQQRDGDGWVVRRFDPATNALTTIARALPGSDFHAWLPDGTLLMARGDALYRWRDGQPGWQLMAAFGADGLRQITRLAVSPDGRWLALVADDPGN